MATAETGTALLILVGFVLPGFVAVLIKERMYEVRGEESPFDRVLTTAYYSVLVWTIPALVAIAAGADRQALERFFDGRAPVWATAFVAASVLLVVPIGAACVAWLWMNSAVRRSLLRRLGIGHSHRFPSSWDWAFDSHEDVLVVVTLRDGERIAGYYGKRSHSGRGPTRRDLFIEERWYIADDGRALRGPAPGSLGVWISPEDIVVVERYDFTHARRAAAAHRQA